MIDKTIENCLRQWFNAHDEKYEWPPELAYYIAESVRIDIKNALNTVLDVRPVGAPK